jgi:hypothetical protein
MVTAARTLLALVGALAVACSGSSSSNDMSDAATDAHDAGHPKHDAGADTGVDAGPVINVAPVIVDDGPPGVQALNTLYTTVTLCRPGTKVCQTIDHIEVDTGSIGLRIVSSVLDKSLMLPAEKASDGNPVVECYQYVDGYNWGTVANADVQIGGEVATGVPIQVAGGASTFTVPSDCSSAGTEEDTVMAFGGNGLVGIGFQKADCGAACASTTDPLAGFYYSCTSTSCTPTSVAIPEQLQNPVGLFAHDNNGVAVHLPSIAASGAATVMGTLTFGIGTASNNGLGAAKVITIDPTSGYFTTTFNGQTLSASFIDSGSLSYAFPDTSIPQCTGDLTGFFCPTTSLNLMATNTGTNKVAIPTPFDVGNGMTIYGSGKAASDDLAITDFGPGGYFDWGLTFFYGRTVFTAISGAKTPGGVGPYFAY